MDDEELFKPLHEMGLDGEHIVRNYPTVPMYEVKDLREQVRYWQSNIIRVQNEQTQELEDRDIGK